jgi:hypothetical protein
VPYLNQWPAYCAGHFCFPGRFEQRLLLDPKAAKQAESEKESSVGKLARAARIKLTAANSAQSYLRSPLPGLNATQKKQDNYNNENQTQSAARIIAPTSAMRPGGKRAEQHQNEQHENDSS